LLAELQPEEAIKLKEEQNPKVRFDPLAPHTHLSLL
jgi:hypothetical protein